MADDFLIEGGSEVVVQRVFHQDKRPEKKRLRSVCNIEFDENHRYLFVGSEEHFEQFAAIMSSYCIFPEEGDEVQTAADANSGQPAAGAGGQTGAGAAADKRKGASDAKAATQGASAAAENGGSAERQEVKKEGDDFDDFEV